MDNDNMHNNTNSDNGEISQNLRDLMQSVVKKAPRTSGEPPKDVSSSNGQNISNGKDYNDSLSNIRASVEISEEKASSSMSATSTLINIPEKSQTPSSSSSSSSPSTSADEKDDDSDEEGCCLSSIILWPLTFILIGLGISFIIDDEYILTGIFFIMSGLEVNPACKSGLGFFARIIVAIVICVIGTMFIPGV